MLAAFLLFMPAAWASTQMALDVPALTQGADWVVQGRVLRTQPRWIPGTGRLVTAVEVSVGQVLKGTVTHPSVEVLLPGGTLGGLRQHVSGAPAFAPGEEVVLFLAKGGEGPHLVGLSQGSFRVQRSAPDGRVRAASMLAADLQLIDPLSLQPVSPAPRTVDLQTLRDEVLAVAAAEASPAPAFQPFESPPGEDGPVPFVRTRVPQEPGAGEEHCLWWPGGSTLTFHQQVCMPGEPDCAARQAAVALALNSWDDALVACASLRLAEGPATSSRQVGYSPGGPNENILVLRDRTCTQQEEPDCWEHQAETLALTTITFRMPGGEVLDADIEIAPWAFVPHSPLSLQAVVTHELGHALGLDHSPDSRSTMYATVTPGEAPRLTLDEGSQQAMCAIYPSGAPAVDCAQQVQEQPLQPEASGCGVATGGGMPALVAGGVLLALRRRRSRSTP
ncbi:matrixin family metalloprotease [Stigmatella erecta]|uniref:Matrixin n=1 Tax=Stigmatella erecta TaxID=83460 RepID=A0A1H9Z616_9BACT|nr:matrixin family metalloprotease [Stigmatella erecta]SES76953.1 Matrixin [Stigmatella erecta]